MIKSLSHILIGLFSVVTLNLSAQYQADIDTLTNRYLREYLERKIDIKSLENSLRTMQPDGSWDDIDYITATPHFQAGKHLDRLTAMALAYCKDPKYAGSGKLLNKIELGLKFFNKKDPKSTNWWYNDIGSPQKYMVIVLLLKNKIDREKLLSYSSYLKDKTGNKAHRAKNRTWVSVITINKGCIEDDYSLIETGFNSIASTIKFEPVQGTEGIKIDYSIHQHRPQIYSGAYGMSFVSDLADYIKLSQGTSFEKLFTPEKRELLANLFLQGQRLLGYRNAIDFGTIGRNISRPDAMANINPDLLDLLTDIDPEHGKDYQAWKDHIVNNAPFAAIGNKHFWKSDIMVYHRANYYLSAKINSKRTNGTEMLNRENLKGYYLPLGATNILTDGNEYRNIFPIWDWARIPGTTASINQDSTILRGYHYGTNQFGGGVSNGESGIMAYEHDYRDIQARKAYFFMDNKLLCLGNSISSSLPDAVTTSVNQCFSNGDIIVNDGKERKLNDQIITDKLKWAYHNNVGYIFPQGGSINVQNKKQTGSWYEINEDGSKAIIEKDVFSIWIDHGSYPQNSNYCYIITPDISLNDFRLSNQDHGFEIINSTGELQAIKNKNSYAIVFYKPGIADMQDFKINSDSPAMVLIERSVEGDLKISVSDPLYQKSSLNLMIDRKLTGEAAVYENGKTCIAFELPQEDFQGSTVTKIFKNK